MGVVKPEHPLLLGQLSPSMYICLPEPGFSINLVIASAMVTPLPEGI
jgi:hypothetical protein